MSFHLADVDSEYAKNPDLRRQDVQALEQWLEKQPHLPKIAELQLILFLQSCYYRMEAAKKAIDNFFTCRTLCPELFGFPQIEALKRNMAVGSINVLPKRTPEGYAVIVMKLLDSNPDHYDHLGQINMFDIHMMVNLHRFGTCEGIVAVADLKGLSFGHMTKFSLVALKKHLFYIQEAAPFRIKGVHYINIVPFTDKLIALAKPFMKKELVDLLNFHTELDTLFKFVPKEILPKDYGGEAPDFLTLHEQSTKDLLDNADIYKWLDTLKVDESRRPGKPKNAGDIFGVDGSFKKLEVD